MCYPICTIKQEVITLEEPKKNVLPIKWDTPKLVRLTPDKAEGALVPAAVVYVKIDIAGACDVPAN